jgi:ELWxxDGT repeat protein
LVALDSRLLFAANDLAHGDELWVSDGASEDTRLLCDINSGPGDSMPTAVIRIGPKIVFSAYAPEYGRELWCSDGTTSGTGLVKDIRQGPADATPRTFLAIGDRVYFVADDDQSEATLWRTDGTEHATVRLADITPALAHWKVETQFELRGSLYFYATRSGDKQLLWTIREIDGEPHMLESQMASSDTHASVKVGRIDGMDRIRPTSSAESDEIFPAQLVNVIHPPLGSPEAHRAIALGNFTYFTAYSTESGSELWKTDGTLAGTTLVLDCFPGPASSSPTFLASHESRFLFVADHPQHGRVLWESDGSSDGTSVVLPVDSTAHPGPPIIASEASYLKNRVIVVAGSIPSRPAHDREIIVLRESAGNITLSFHDISAKMHSSDSRSLTPVGNDVYFVANDDISGEELWKLDLATDTASLVRDILPYRTPASTGK